MAVFFGCSTIKDKEQPSLHATNALGFTEFYKVLVIPELSKETFDMDDQKTVHLKIINNGVKELYIPKWFDLSSGKKSELYIELYKKKNTTYERYTQESKWVTTNIQSNTNGREILVSKNGNPICITNIALDSFLTIVDSGEFLAKIYIDLSDFGYFKILETEVFFKVKD